MTLTDKQSEHLYSIHTAASDILRWSFTQAKGQRLSRDMLRDIHMQSARISELVTRLQLEKNDG